MTLWLLHAIIPLKLVYQLKQEKRQWLVKLFQTEAHLNHRKMNNIIPLGKLLNEYIVRDKLKHTKIGAQLVALIEKKENHLNDDGITIASMIVAVVVGIVLAAVLAPLAPHLPTQLQPSGIAFIAGVVVLFVTHNRLCKRIATSPRVAEINQQISELIAQNPHERAIIETPAL